MRLLFFEIQTTISILYQICRLDGRITRFSFSFFFSILFFVSVFAISSDRSICNGILGSIPNTDLFQMNHGNISLNGPTPSDDYLEHDDGNHFFGTKCMPMKALDTDYMIVSSEEIIDILDLTNDEVEQILDDNMISSQDFDTLNSPRLSQSTVQPFNRMPRINLATNLTKVASPLMGDYEGKTIDMRSLETPTINLDITLTENECETIEAAKLNTEPISVAKKKSGRTKGARQISKCFFPSTFFLYIDLCYSFTEISVFHQFHHIYITVSLIAHVQFPIRCDPT